MSNNQSRQAGFSTGLIIAAVLVLAVIGGVGFVVFKKSATKQATTTPPTTEPVEEPAVGQEPAKTSEVTKAYNNEEYGISFSYPEKWEISESKPGPQPESPAPVEFGVSTSRITTDKYKTTAVIEVYSKNLDAMSDFYTDKANQNTKATLNKTEKTDKNKPSVHLITTFEVTDGSSYVTKRYLFAVGDKTYALRTINEELNAQVDPNYAASACFHTSSAARRSKRATPATVSTTSASICSMPTPVPFAQLAVQ